MDRFGFVLAACDDPLLHIQLFDLSHQLDHLFIMFMDIRYAANILHTLIDLVPIEFHEFITIWLSINWIDDFKLFLVDLLFAVEHNLLAIIVLYLYIFLQLQLLYLVQIELTDNLAQFRFNHHRVNEFSTLLFAKVFLINYQQFILFLILLLNQYLSTIFIVIVFILFKLIPIFLELA